jgi:hypothetical protein
MILNITSLYPHAMSVDGYTNEAASEATKSTDFETDLKRIGGITQQAIIQGRENDDEFGKATLEQADAVMHWFDRNDIPPEQAIAAAWFFILSFD